MKRIFVIVTLALSVLELFGQGQKGLFEKWEMSQERLRYFSIDSIKKEFKIHEINQIDTGVYAINDLIFYRERSLSATFPGGKDSLKLFIREHLEFQPYNEVYPRVIVAFIVNEKGEILYPGILRGAESVYNLAALNLIRKLPHWVPAKKGGECISTFNSVLIDFTIK